MEIVVVAPFIRVYSTKSIRDLAFLNINIGGAELSSETLCRALSSQQNNVTVVTSTMSSPLEKDNLKILPILRPKLCLVAGKFIPVNFPPLKKILKEIQPEAIILQDNYSAGFFYNQSRYPIIQTIRDYWFSCPQKTLLNKIEQNFCKKDSYLRCMQCYRAKRSSILISHLSSSVFQLIKKRINNFLNGCNGILFTGTDLMTEFNKRFDIKRPLTVTGNAINISRINFTEEKKQQFIYCGRLSSEKGIILLIQAFRKYKRKGGKYKLKIVGQGPYASLINRSFKDIIIQNWINQKALHREISSSNCAISVPLWKEPFGRFQLESIMLGTPIIVPNDGEPKYFVQKTGAGIILSNRNISEIVNSMVYFEHNSENLNNLANMNKIVLQKEYNPAAVADRTIIFIRKIIDQ